MDDIAKASADAILDNKILWIDDIAEASADATSDLISVVLAKEHPSPPAGKAPAEPVADAVQGDRGTVSDDPQGPELDDDSSKTLGQNPGQNGDDSGTDAHHSGKKTNSLLSPSRQWNSDCDAIRDAWFKDMKSPPAKWIPQLTFIKEFLAGKQNGKRLIKRWKSVTVDTIYLRFKNNRDKWKTEADKLKAQPGG
jgi:hypothetical protein